MLCWKMHCYRPTVFCKGLQWQWITTVTHLGHRRSCEKSTFESVRKSPKSKGKCRGDQCVLFKEEAQTKHWTHWCFLERHTSLALFFICKLINPVLSQRYNLQSFSIQKLLTFFNFFNTKRYHISSFVRLL